MFEAVKWYTYYLGLDVNSVNNDERYAVLRMGMNYDPESSYTYILEEIAIDNFTGKVDGSVRVRHYVEVGSNFSNIISFSRKKALTRGILGDIPYKE